MNRNETGNLIIFLMTVFLFVNLAFPVKSETVIYDNITSSNYKYLTLDEFSTFFIIEDYKYEVLLNGYFIGYYGKNEKIFIPDNSTITIIIPSPIKTSGDDIWGTSIKPQLFTFIGFLFSWGFGIILLISLIGYVFYRIWRKTTRGY